MNKVIKTITASNYRGSFDTGSVSGNFQTDGEKNIVNIDGVAKDLGSFDAYRGGEELSFTFRPETIDKGAALVEAAKKAVDSVKAELAE